MQDRMFEGFKTKLIEYSNFPTWERAPRAWDGKCREVYGVDLASQEDQTAVMISGGNRHELVTRMGSEFEDYADAISRGMYAMMTIPEYHIFKEELRPIPGKQNVKKSVSELLKELKAFLD
jgi:NurA-like 5'-3' nuclease